jgi:hypothetical protein
MRRLLMLLLVACALTEAGAAPASKNRVARNAIIERSKVWLETDIPSLDLKRGPDEPVAFELGATVRCDYVDRKLSGGTPKFACRLPDGDEIKVKYGGTNGEVYGEVVASRLLWALGFGADRMYSARVVCRGCPDRIGTAQTDAGERILDPAAIERKLTNDVLSDEWSWDELDKVNPAAGGATAAERDALKLVAVLIQHNDNKAMQQRIVCLERAEDRQCTTPLMMINDLGITFGRSNAFNLQLTASVNLADWAKLPVWKDSGGCVGNLPGSLTGTMKYPAISEPGRQFLADRLMQLSDQQIHDMFEAARVNLRPRIPASGRSDYPTIDEWVAAFKAKRDQIVNRHCNA